MNEALTITSYTLAAIAGICFVTGVAVLTSGRSKQPWMV